MATSWEELTGDSTTWENLGEIKIDFGVTNLSFITLVNKCLASLNEVQLTEGTFQETDGFATYAKDAINKSLQQIYQHQQQWPFCRSTGSQVLTPGVVAWPLDLPADAKVVDWDSFRILRDATLGITSQRLTPIDYDTFVQTYRDNDENAQGSTPGQKPLYVFRGPAMAWGVCMLPDKPYKVAFEYWRVPADLKQFDDSPAIPEAFSSVIIDGAMYYLYMFRDNSEAALISQKRFESGLADLKAAYVNIQRDFRSGQIRGRG